MSTTTRANTLAAVEAEIREEMANSLGRTGRSLEACIAEMTDLRARLSSLDGPARARAVARHDELYDEAHEHLFALVVQREAMGLRSHLGLERAYPIPPRLEPRKR